MTSEQPAAKPTSVPYPAHMQVPWPEVDPLELRVTQDDEEITLMTYRYPVPHGTARKGYIFFIHGFGAYFEHYAGFCKSFAERGYECLALDQRGFGNSGGHRGLFESEDVIYGDLYLFIMRAIQQYRINLQTESLFLYGKSFGSILAYNMCVRYPTLFKGLGLVAPFFEHFNPTIEKYSWVFKLFNLFQFYHSFSHRDTSRPGYAEYAKKYAYNYQDTKVVHEAKISTFVTFSNEQAYAKSNLKNFQTPMVVL